MRRSEREQPPGIAHLCTSRWVALLMQGGVLLGLSQVEGARVPWAPLLSVLLLIALSNWWLARQKGISPRSSTIGALLLIDVVALTILLWGTGGPANPFSVSYLVQVTLAAVLATGPWMWSVLLASCLGFATLFWWHVPLPPALGGHGHHGGQGSYSVHLQLMWLAFALVGSAIAISVSRLSRALAWEQERQEKSARLLGMAALAAGAAHEIGNPLGTIRIAASELERDMKKKGSDAEQLADIELIGQEVTRASAVLQKMASAAGELQGEGLAPSGVRDFVNSLLEEEGCAHEQVVLEIEGGEATLRWPLAAVRQALSQLLRNAIQASAGKPVRCRVISDAQRVQISFEDQGPGMNPDLLSRVGEPFLTTREGTGMGLGLFIAKSLIEQLRGRLELRRGAQGGTVAWVELPREVGESL